MDSLSTVLIQYPATDEQIANMREEFANIHFDDAEGYERGRKAIAALRSFRGAVEKKRKELKADSLEFGRRVDSTAKHFTGLILAIEEPLQSKKEAVDNAKEIARRAAEDAEREALRLAEQAKLDAQRAELARVEEEQRIAREAEAARHAEEARILAAGRAAIEAEAEALRLEREQFNAARAAATPLVPKEPEPARSLADTEPPPAPPPAIAWVSGESQDSARLRGFAAALRSVPRPAVGSDTAAAVLEQVEFILEEALQALESFGAAEGAATAAE